MTREEHILNSPDSNKQSILLHPVVSIVVILLFAWLAFIHAQIFMESGHYRHLLFIIASMIIIINRVLWLPKVSVLIERKSAYKIPEARDSNLISSK